MLPLIVRRTTGLEFSYARQARIALVYPGIDQRMPLIHLDRDGLAFHLNRHLTLPSFGLPQKVTLLASAGEVVCELRIIARNLEPTPNGHQELTVQPSRTSDHEIFWQALRAFQLRHRKNNTHSVIARQLKSGHISSRGRRSLCFHPCWNTSSCVKWPASTSAHIVMVDTPRRDDALFVAEWLEYYFAELSARVQIAAPCSVLQQIDTQLTGCTLQIQFSYDFDAALSQAPTNQVCAWIENELKKQFGINVVFHAASHMLESDTYSQPQIN